MRSRSDDANKAQNHAHGDSQGPQDPLQQELDESVVAAENLEEVVERLERLAHRLRILAELYVRKSKPDLAHKARQDEHEVRELLKKYHGLAKAEADEADHIIDAMIAALDRVDADEQPTQD